MTRSIRRRKKSPTGANKARKPVAKIFAGFSLAMMAYIFSIEIMVGPRVLEYLEFRKKLPKGLF
ncbi:MAG TPA: hypothetical protein DF383_09775 [Deltaproteobacteria bacterium]|nr:hypothetical protein [Deltaproteobacteria bacterium]